MIKKTLLYLAATLFLLYLCVNVYAYAVSDKLLFAPREPSYTQLPDELKIASGDGAITAVYLEKPDAEYTILFSHGNAVDLGYVYPIMKKISDLGYSVLMYDYRGYGTSEGQPTAAHAKQDATAAYNWLVNEKKIDPRKIISQGRSLGGGVAVWLAARQEVGGLITEISFTSAMRVKTHRKVLLVDKFDSLRSIRHVDCPVLVIHGTDDVKIPFWHGQKVYDAAREPKRCLWIDKGRHATYWKIDENLYHETIVRFIDDLVDR